MDFKIFTTVLWVFILINLSSSWSSSINSLFKSKQLLQFNEGLSPIIIDSVAAGAQMAMDECKSVFKWDKWNCPQSSFSMQYNQLATKERAYTDAIIAAGIIYSITRDCSQGTIKGCGCNSNPMKNIYKDSSTEGLIETQSSPSVKDWVWGGCSDDASFGENLVLKFLESNNNGRYSDPQAFASRHNNRIGREIIREKMLKSCKCHGVSGSCSFQTCWMQMPTFSQIARQLRDRYNKAVLISFEKIRGALTLGNSARQLPLQAAEELLSNNLVYLEKSEDFCYNNSITGWPGTKGRICSRTNLATASIAEKKSCRNLCRSCGYKVRKQENRVSHRCNCKFIWCCEVECDVCVQNVEEFFCQ